MDSRLLAMLNTDLKEKFEASKIVASLPLPSTRPDLKKNTLIKIIQPRSIEYFYNRLDMAKRCYKVVTVPLNATVENILTAINRTDTPLLLTDVQVAVNGSIYQVTAKDNNEVWTGSVTVTVNH